MAESVYPVESAGDAAWGRSTEYLKDSVEHFSQRWFIYPYPTPGRVAGGSSGMEYPGMAFDGIGDRARALFWITAHEIGHTWYPMTVGSDERRDAWMDEGFNTFIDVYESDQFEGGVYGPKRDSDTPRAAAIRWTRFNPCWPIRSPAHRLAGRHDQREVPSRGDLFKTALGLVLLREQILGPDRFDPAFRKYTADWAFKHPKPSDFFRAMESEPARIYPGTGVAGS